MTTKTTIENTETTHQVIPSTLTLFAEIEIPIKVCDTEMVAWTAYKPNAPPTTQSAQRRFNHRNEIAIITIPLSNDLDLVAAKNYVQPSEQYKVNVNNEKKTEIKNFVNNYPLNYLIREKLYTDKQKINIGNDNNIKVLKVYNVPVNKERIKDNNGYYYDQYSTNNRTNILHTSTQYKMPTVAKSFFVGFGAVAGLVGSSSVKKHKALTFISIAASVTTTLYLLNEDHYSKKPTIISRTIKNICNKVEYWFKNFFSS